MPPKLTNPGAEGLAYLRAKDTQLIQIMDAALADATARSGEHLACRPGCAQCCHGAFAINPLDAQRLRAGMAKLASTDPAHAARIEARAQAYLAEHAPNFPGSTLTGILDTSEEAEMAFEDFANEAPCPALNPDSGLCDLYEARPMTCRIFGPPVRIETESGPDLTPAADATPAFAICELCFTTATEEQIAAAEMIVPHQQEQELLEQLLPGDTIVAYCLTLPLTPSKTASSAPQ